MLRRGVEDSHHPGLGFAAPEPKSGPIGLGGSSSSQICVEVELADGQERSRRRRSFEADQFIEIPVVGDRMAVGDMALTGLVSGRTIWPNGITITVLVDLQACDWTKDEITQALCELGYAVM